MINDLILYLQTEFESVANQAKAPQMKAYMKNKFDFIGISSPVRTEILKVSFQKFPLKTESELFEFTKKMWDQPFREFQYVGLDYFYKYRKLISKDSLTQFEHFIVHKSWWDTVDMLSTDLVGEYFLKFPNSKETQIDKWLSSENMWLQRVCIIHQLHYKEKTDVDLLIKAILYCKDSNEFFIQKAIGWALRQYARTDADFVKEFVHQHTLKPLSKREALKHF